MDEPRKNQVSLRGASAKEITRDALLEKVSQERELRNYARRAARAALLIQRVWRRHHVVKLAALQLQEEWISLGNSSPIMMTRTWIYSRFLRPFLFFTVYLSTKHRSFQSRDVECIRICFKTLLESINSTDSVKNYCFLAVGTVEEREIWIFQAQKLIRLCFYILAEYGISHNQDQDIVILGIRLVVALTDLKVWKIISHEDMNSAHTAVNNLVCYLGSRSSGMYSCIRKYIRKMSIFSSSQISITAQPDDKFLITASAITLALRPFHAADFAVNDLSSLDLLCVSEQFLVLILTIPCISLRLPSVLVPALRHKSILSSCFRTLMIFKDKILLQMSNIDQWRSPICPKLMPQVGWALANTICLATESENGSSSFGQFTRGLDYALYVHAVIAYSENFLSWVDKAGCIKLENHDDRCTVMNVTKPVEIIMQESETAFGPFSVSYMDLLMPVCQQWHLTELLAALKKDKCSHVAHKPLGVRFELLDIAYLYSYMLRIFSALNPAVGSLPILNMLSFTHGFLANLLVTLEKSVFPGNCSNGEEDICRSQTVETKNVEVVKKQKGFHKDGSSKWTSLINRFSGKTQVDLGPVDLTCAESKTIEVVNTDSCDVWDIEPLKHGVQGISKDTLCLLHLFCATYSHLLLVLDDIEFYEKQVPFTLEQQRRIAAMLNTFVYDGLSHGSGQQDKSVMDAAIRCLHLLYERDCRHQFCPTVLWLSPARESRPPIAAAARTFEVLSANLRSDDELATPRMGSVIITTPHVFPFEERVQMFREFINMDKVSRRIAGEMGGPGPGSVEIVIRRGHIIEDGFQQLNSLGSRLKSSIHVSFVSESGLQEAGLDYGGLTKEFLTDITKAAFATEYGLFSQTSTSDGLLVPNTSARFLVNGIPMIEFLGKVVGKALYEGILLDYSFSHVFVQKLLGRYSFLDELSTLDPELYRNLMFVKHYEGDVKELSLDFTITEDLYGKRQVIELKPGGKDVSVTNENKLQYVHAIADYKLNRQLLPLSNAFYRGLTIIISPSWLKLFNASEFNQLLSGGSHDIDINDLRNNTRYSGGYSEGSRPVKLFWEVLKGFEPKERCMLLKFVTGCSRGPLLGFKHLQPAFTIHKVACDMPLWATIGGQDVERLPSASTCYNTLKLPTYKRPSTMRSKLLYAINSNAGFELS